VNGHETTGRPAWRLADFTGAGYDKGRPKLIQALWLASSDVIMNWWFPPKARVAVLRAVGAHIGGTI